MRLLTLLITLIAIPCWANDFATITLADQRLHVELAIDDDEHVRGLMHRDSLAPDSGMLFIYPEPTELSFWMKNTRIALDILFFSTDGTLQQIIRDVPPCRSTPCQHYRAKQASQFVLEVNAGSAKQWHIEPGAHFEIIK